jgi:hypothetical protein
MEKHEKNNSGEFFARANDESINDDNLRDLFKQFFPVDTPQWNHHLQAYLKRHNVMRILYFNEIYQNILTIPGDILDFGVHYGASSALLLNLRGIYEPYNVSRNIHSFDTFEGFVGVSNYDGESEEGSYKVNEDFEQTFKTLMSLHESFSPISHLKRHSITKGDARKTVIDWKKQNPGTLVALLHLDMDLYEPTKAVLSILKDRFFSGTVIVLDELSAKFFPGEMKALSEEFNLNDLKIRRSQFQPYSAYVIVGDK